MSMCLLNTFIDELERKVNAEVTKFTYDTRVVTTKSE